MADPGAILRNREHSRAAHPSNYDDLLNGTMLLLARAGQLTVATTTADVPLGAALVVMIGSFPVDDVALAFNVWKRAPWAPIVLAAPFPISQDALRVVRPHAASFAHILLNPTELIPALDQVHSAIRSRPEVSLSDFILYLRIRCDDSVATGVARAFGPQCSSAALRRRLSALKVPNPARWRGLWQLTRALASANASANETLEHAAFKSMVAPRTLSTCVVATSVRIGGKQRSGADGNGWSKPRCDSGASRSLATRVTPATDGLRS